jgi:hypothetical protein
MRKGERTRRARDRGERFTARRRREEAHLEAADQALATIRKILSSLELAIDLANEQLEQASQELSGAVTGLRRIGYGTIDISEAVDASPSELRPGVSVALRITRGRKVRARTMREPSTMTSDSSSGFEEGEGSGGGPDSTSASIREGDSKNASDGTP